MNNDLLGLVISTFILALITTFIAASWFYRRYVRSRQADLMNASQTLRTVTHSCRGIYKRLDELRELETFLHEEIPELIQEKPWVISWIKGQSIWMTDLIEQLEKISPDFRQYSEQQKIRYRS
ncbi:hypothetical protein BVH03_17615 [Pseudomonas sp. PA15(2017)]|uniref:hypothetical protein n=1 Tax=Pseudomonas sp. PA15(2017) TaxID=1932111 RepID=UPI0009607BE3|nr:hypothetical protein [Pseudomonas sp. PA15(2017)]OLU25474.1 hypothetical protein BVH03_17615 [Pseudomonas sp. PA15(2017)]